MVSIVRSQKIPFFSSFAHPISRINWEENKMKTNSSEFRQMSNFSIDIGLVEKDSAKHSDSFMANREIFLIVYTCIMVFGTLCYIVRSFSFFRLCLQISVNLHDMMFSAVSRAKMSFFVNNPSGRILNRFSGDINKLDSLLPNILADVLDVSLAAQLFIRLSTCTLSINIVLILSFFCNLRRL